jgi:hypothetical protein
MVRMDRAFAAVSGVIAVVRLSPPTLIRCIPPCTSIRLDRGVLTLCAVVLQGLVSGLINGGPVAGGTIGQIEAQNDRRQPCAPTLSPLDLLVWEGRSDKCVGGGVCRRHRCDPLLEQIVQGDLSHNAAQFALQP